MTSCVRFVLYLLAASLIGIAPAHAKRVALVIGNSAYLQGALKNPVNDARAMSLKLTALGFIVIKRENLRQRDIGSTLRELRSRISPGDEVLFFYAGHGVQIRGENYLPSVDAQIDGEEDVPQYSINVNTQLLNLLDESKAGVKLLFLDACRNNPFQRSFRGGGGDFGRIGSAPSGTLIHYATRPGSVASDGTGANGLYTEQLLRYIGQPNQVVESVLKQVSVAVETASKGKQEPWSEGSLKGDFYFHALPTESLSVNKNTQAFMDPDSELWAIVKASTEAIELEEYLKSFPDGKYVIAARARLRQLKPTESAVQRPPAQSVISQVASSRPAVMATDGESPSEWTQVTYRFFTNGSEIQDRSNNLIWQRCSLGARWTGQNCVGKPIQLSLRDATTSSRREADVSAVPWRVPTINELASIVDTGRNNPAIDLSAFPDTPPVRFWTSTPCTVPSKPCDAWTIDFLEGEASTKSRSEDRLSVRLVRSRVNGSSTETSAMQETQLDKMKAQLFQIVKDCELCPEMITIPAGVFNMGSSVLEDDEGPVHSVTMNSFLLGKTEVTQGQWRALMGANPSHFSDCGEDCPVEQISRADALAYTQKLSAMTGKRYRLPSEAEWEFAARAGSMTKYPWGEQANHDHANFGSDVCCEGLKQAGDRWENTAPVGQFPPNAYGLYDMHGNVGEWVEDEWHYSYDGAPNNGAAWKSNDGRPGYAVIRGGDWSSPPARISSTSREWSMRGNGNGTTGFRVARAL